MVVQVFFVKLVKNNNFIIMFKKFTFSIICLAIFSVVFSCAQETKKSKQKEYSYEISEYFVQGSEDIPLLVGMEQINNDVLGFDTASGSIMSSSYETLIDFEMIKKFYIETLPQIGWQISNNSPNKISFNREKETLEINFLTEDVDIVRFLISSEI